MNQVNSRSGSELRCCGLSERKNYADDWVELCVVEVEGARQKVTWQGPNYKKILRLSYDVIITYDNRKSNLR